MAVDCSGLEAVDPERFLGSVMTVVWVNGEPGYLCLETAGEVVRIEVENFYSWEHYSFTRDEHGLTGRDEWRMQTGQTGTLMRRDQYANDGRYYLVGKTFDDVYGSEQDLLFEKVWLRFRKNVIERYNQIVSIPMWMNSSEFSADFSPQDACWWAKEYSYSVQIDKSFSFCQYDFPYNGYSHVDVSGWYIYSGHVNNYEDDTSLIAVLPNSDDSPLTLEVGQESNGLTLVACVPVEGYSDRIVQNGRDFESMRAPYFHYEGNRYGGPVFTQDYYYVDTMGVVFEINGQKVGDLMPFGALLEYVVENDGGFTYQLYQLPKECLKRLP